MRVELGSRDDERFQQVEAGEREYLSFLLSLCLAVLARRPNQLEALHNGANALTALGYYEDGLLLDRRLATLQPSDATVVYNLACSLALTRHLDEAFEILSRAIRLGYHDAGHMAKDDDLRSLRADERFRDLLEAAQRPLPGGAGSCTTES